MHLLHDINSSNSINFKNFKPGTKMVRAQLLFVLCTLGTTLAWVNDYDEPFTFECPAGRYISWFQSNHDDGAEDRIFDFQCSDYIGEPSDCVWSDWVNEYDETFAYTCPNNYMLSGIESIHDNDYEDRRFKLYCCTVPDFSILDCNWTPYVNDLDEDFIYVLDESRVLCGLGSAHDDAAEDRRFEMIECENPNDSRNQLEQKESPIPHPV